MHCLAPGKDFFQGDCPYLDLFIGIPTQAFCAGHIIDPGKVATIPKDRRVGEAVTDEAGIFPCVSSLLLSSLTPASNGDSPGSMIPPEFPRKAPGWQTGTGAP